MGVNTCLWSDFLKINFSNDQVTVAAENISAEFIACELWGREG